MYGGGREKKSKPSKRAQQAAAAAAAEEQPAQVPPPPRKKGGKNKHFRDESEEFFGEFGIPHESGRSSTGERLGATNLPALSLFPATSESVFKNWEELLGSREALKSRMDQAVLGRLGLAHVDAQLEVTGHDQLHGRLPRPVLLRREHIVHANQRSIALADGAELLAALESILRLGKVLHDGSAMEQVAGAGTSPLALVWSGTGCRAEGPGAAERPT